jgi:YD repeat-containing protein
MAGGRLKKRTWARGITSTYTYTHAGELDTIDYSDTTTDVDFDYDRRGRATQVTDGIGTQTMDYNDPGQLTDYNYTSGLLNGITVTSGYDDKFRRNSLGVQVPVQGSVYSVSYGYDAASRLKTVTDNNNHSATYTYLPNSSLVTNIVFASGGFTKMTTYKSYDNLNRLKSISSVSSGSSVVSSHAYEYNAANQRG